MLKTLIFLIATADPLWGAGGFVFGMEEPRPTSPAEIAARRALKSPVSLRFQEVPLNAPAVELQTMLGIDVRMDGRALDNAGSRLTCPCR
jgi:hypothetical protein